MDFIERWFGVSPDGGNGRLELMIIVSALVAGCALVVAAVPRLRRKVLGRAGVPNRPAPPIR